MLITGMKPIPFGPDHQALDIYFENWLEVKLAGPFQSSI
jgi:hypothetical protein